MRKALLIASPGGGRNFSRLACTENDVVIVKDLLEATGEYSNIDTLLDPTADQVKDALREYIGNSADQLSEFLLYFSGHGYENENDLYYVLNGFNKTSPSSTGLSDQELIQFVRDIGADLFVHVSDACFSGRRMLKSERPAPHKEVGNFIRFSSSAEAEESIGGDSLSLFTDHFIEAALKKSVGSIYYSDIAAALSDAFIKNPRQTPVYFSQAPLNVVFSQNQPSLDRLRLRYQFEETEMPDQVPETNVQSEDSQLVQAGSRLSRIAAKCTSVEDMAKYLSEIEVRLSELKLSGALAEFSLDVRISSSRSFYGVEGLGEVVNALLRGDRIDNFVEPFRIDITPDDDSFQTTLTALVNPFSPRKTRVFEYRLENHSNFENLYWSISVFSAFDFLGSFRAELIFCPSFLACDTFMRIGYARPTGRDRSFQGIKLSEWTHKVLDWDVLPEAVNRLVLENLETQIRQRTDRLLDQLDNNLQ